MKISLLFSTLSYLRIEQILYQLKNRLIKEKYRELSCPNEVQFPVWTSYISKNKSSLDNVFHFLHLSSSFSSWNDTTHGMLWAYNLNYMDWLLQKGMTCEEGTRWIDKFILELPHNRIGLDPYPIALRGINWIKFISLHKDRIDEYRMKRWNDSLYSQYMLLQRKLEYHLLGNHLMEDAFSLYIAAIYFKDANMYQKASWLLIKELKEQTLMDGAHYEQSPMYHCILLDRLLDCYNIASNNVRFSSQEKDISTLREYCLKMLGHLECIVYNNKTFPIFNDTAMGIAPSPVEIFDYAKRLGLTWFPIPLKESGYRKMSNSKMEVMVDIGNVAASYQAGHTHADALNYELRIDNKPFIVDTGISTYNKTPRRQYERSTKAHNCVVVDGKNSSDVWGGFRLGKRCRVSVIVDEPNNIEAFHNGYEKKCLRKFQLDEKGVTIEDRYDGPAVSYIHLAHDADINKINIEGASKIEVLDTQYSIEYNRFISNKTIAIHFNGSMNYRIRY